MYYSELPTRDQPQNRISELSGQALNTEELVSVALQIKTVEAAQALAKLYHQYESLGAIPKHEVTAIPGLGETTYSRIQAISEFVNREIQYRKSGDQPVKINCPRDAAEIVMYEMASLEQEQMRVMLLDNRNQVKKIVTVYQGTKNNAQINVGELFKEAIRDNATSIVLAHNHPSGDPAPSPDDVAVTRAIVQAGKLLDIEVLDHLVIGKGRFVSLKERGMGFS
jgi:DNA repair protein RadC